MAKLDDLVKAGSELSTATDRLSVTVDKLTAAADRVVAALQNQDLPPDAAAAVDALKTASASAAAAGDRADAEVTKLDTILPTPAPAGTP